jgi:hypothetical protein
VKNRVFKVDGRYGGCRQEPLTLASALQRAPSRLVPGTHKKLRPPGRFRSRSGKAVPRISVGRQFHNAQEGWYGLEALSRCTGEKSGSIFGRRQQVSNPALLRRREFIGLLGAAAACPLTAAAQSLQPDIGLVSIARARPTRRIFPHSCNRWASSATAGGRNINLECRFCGGQRQPNRGVLG